jgi:Lar family restriction alleviation protein
MSGRHQAVEKLKACPFCGSAQLHLNSCAGLHWVCCDGCGVIGHMSRRQMVAIDRWNKRAPGVPPTDWITRQALILSPDDASKEKVGALAWSLLVAFRRWIEGEPTTETKQVLAPEDGR